MTDHAMRRVWIVALGLALSLPLTSSGAVEAQDVGSLHILPASGEGSAREVFAQDTAAVMARFDYEDASRTSIAVVVKSRGGLIAFRQEDRYSGSGTADVTIDGAAFYPTLVAAIDDSAREARRNADRAANPDLSAGTREFLRSVQAGLLRVQHASETLQAGRLEDAVSERMADLDRLRNEAMDLVERAVSLPSSELPRKKDLSAQAAERIGSMVLIAGDLQSLVTGEGERPIPSTGRDEQAAYVVQLILDGDVAASAEMWVHGSGAIYLPNLAR